MQSAAKHPAVDAAPGRSKRCDVPNKSNLANSSNWIPFRLQKCFPSWCSSQSESTKRSPSCFERGMAGPGRGMFRFERELLAAKLVDFPLVRTERDGVGLYESLKRDSKEDYAGG